MKDSLNFPVLFIAPGLQKKCKLFSLWVSAEGNDESRTLHGLHSSHKQKYTPNHAMWAGWAVVSAGSAPGTL